MRLWVVPYVLSSIKCWVCLTFTLCISLKPRIFMKCSRLWSFVRLYFVLVLILGPPVLVLVLGLHILVLVLVFAPLVLVRVLDDIVLATRLPIICKTCRGVPQWCVRHFSETGWRLKFARTSGSTSQRNLGNSVWWFLLWRSGACCLPYARIWVSAYLSELISCWQAWPN